MFQLESFTMRIISDNYDTPATIQTSLSIVVAVYNEQEVLAKFHYQLANVLTSLTHIQSEIIYINDGSSDSTWDILKSLPSNGHTIKLFNLSRNFGKEAAMTAGLDHAKSDAVILLDADLQDPPELIPKMIASWQQGFDVVNMRRSQRHGESKFKKWTAHAFYRLLALVSDEVVIKKDVGDFRLLSQRVVQQINKLPERNRYMKGLMAWPGFKQVTLEFERPQRAAGKTKWNFIELVALGLSGITSFSIKPLKIATWLGVSISLAAFFYSAFLFLETLIFGNQVQGYPSLMLAQLWLGGVQLLAIGVLGEYIGRIYKESKGRPIYIVEESLQLTQNKADEKQAEQVTYASK